MFNDILACTEISTRGKRPLGRKPGRLDQLSITASRGARSSHLKSGVLLL